MRFWNPAMETKAPEEVRRLQQERLINLINWAYRRIPFYRRKFDAAGCKPSDIRGLDDIHKVPLTTKQELCQSQEKAPPFGDYVADPCKIFRTFWSTGTTGRPTLMVVSRREAKYWDEVIARNLWEVGLRPGDGFYHATQLSGFVGGFGFLTVANKMGANVIPAGAGRSERHLTLLATLRPSFVKILPSYALYLAELALKLGMNPKDFRVRKIFLSAEPVPDTLRVRLEELWGAEAYDSYGLSDVGQPQAFECQARSGLHDIPDWNLTEILDPETGQPLPPGKEGILVYTNLVRRTMPIIRFFTNDISAWKEFGPCSCGRPSARIERVMRRADDVRKVKGINLWPSAAQGIIGEFPELTGNFRLIVDAPQGRDRVKLIAEWRGEPYDPAFVRDRLYKRLSEALFINFDEIELVPLRTLEKSEHKETFIVDRR